MFSTAVMMTPRTCNEILAAMISVRDAHGWDEPASTAKSKAPPTIRTGRTKAKKKNFSAFQRTSALKKQRKPMPTKSKKTKAKAPAKKKAAKKKK
jgi:hypothetical protein